MKIFVPITKVDVEKREVWGRAVAEVPDRAKEIFDYATSVPFFKDWSASFEKATAALPEPSLGNIRAMHGKVAAGKVIAFAPSDTDKAIDIGTKIVDDNEWQKCLEGIYTGFSIGGSYLKKWKDATDPTLTRYTASPSEISLVDLPCVPTAQFAVVKADGASETKSFQRYGLLKSAIEKSDLTMGELLDLSNEYLPSDEMNALAKADATMGELRDRLRAVANAAPVADATEPAAAAVEKLEQTETPATPATPTLSPTEKIAKFLRKGMYSVQTFAGIIQSLAWLAQDTQAEAAWENDASTVPADLRTALQLLCEIFKKMSAEETAELIASILPEGTEAPIVTVEVIELAAAAEDLAKAGKRHSAGDQKLVQALHDNASALGADCAGMDKAAGGDLAKVSADLGTALEKVSTLEKTVTDLTAERETLAKKVTDLEAMPLPPKGKVRVVSKIDDVADASASDGAPIAPDPKDPKAVMKAVHAAGGVRIQP